MSERFDDDETVDREAYAAYESSQTKRRLIPEDDQYPVRSFDDVRQLLESGTEMVYLHDQTGKIIAMIIPPDGWWSSHLPEAPPEHFSHDHVYPWGERQ